jgi:hypothetical protein
MHLDTWQYILSNPKLKTEGMVIKQTETGWIITNGNPIPEMEKEIDLLKEEVASLRSQINESKICNTPT